jgi:hypothetical protein
MRLHPACLLLQNHGRLAWPEHFRNCQPRLRFARCVGLQLQILSHSPEPSNSIFIFYIFHRTERPVVNDYLCIVFARDK